jgi:hypothetical protein
LPIDARMKQSEILLPRLRDQNDNTRGGTN